MSKSKIDVTIAGKAPVQPCRSLAMPNDFGPIAAVFFLVFDCAAVETSLTNAQSNTYKSPAHLDTQSVKTCHREKPRK
jgi:hypothetical protein